ncbi:hypothetical protein N9P38_01925 [Flavobacteriales bacterium]|nr:hypothetical protein [Flavobacteriales bacterium]
MSIVSGATHNRGGEITYIHISGNTYQFTITTCTKSSVAADREELEINFGDGTGIDTVNRDTVIFISTHAQKKSIHYKSHICGTWYL